MTVDEMLEKIVNTIENIPVGNTGIEISDETLEILKKFDEI